MIETADISTVMRALADPTRRAVFEAVASAEEISVAELTRGSGVTQGAISQHLKVLREAGLVTVEARGQQRIYRLDPAGLEAFDAWLGKVRRFWGRHLDVLEQELAKPEPGEGENR